MRQAYDYWQDQPDNYTPSTRRGRRGINQVCNAARTRCSRRNIEHSSSKTHDLELRTDPRNVTQPSLALLYATSFLELSLPTDRHTNDASTQINVATAQTDGQQRVIRFRPTRRCHCSTSQRLAEGATTTNASLPILANVTQAVVEIFRY